MSEHFTLYGTIEKRVPDEIKNLYNGYLDKIDRITASSLASDLKQGVVGGIEMCLDEIAVVYLKKAITEHKKI